MRIITTPLQKAYLIHQPGTCAKDHRIICDQKIPKERVRGGTKQRGKKTVSPNSIGREEQQDYYKCVGYSSSLAPHAVRRQKVLKDLSFNPHQERFKAKLTHPQRWVQLPIVEANNLFDTEMVGRLQGRTKQKICTAHYF